LRVDDGTFDADMPISAIMRAEIGADGAVASAEGRIIGGAGFISSGTPESRMLVDEAQVELHWDAVRRVLHLPLDVHSGSNRISFLAQLQAPPPLSGEPG